MPPKVTKTEGTSLSAVETSLLVNIIRYKTGNIASMTDWEKVATASGYKNAANAKTMFSRLCKNKLEKSTDDDTKAPNGGVDKATKTQGKTKAQPKPAGKTTKVKEEEEDDDDEEGFGDTGVEEEKEDEDEESK